MWQGTAAVVDNRRVSAMRFGDPLLPVMLTALLMHAFLLAGFSNRLLSEAVVQLWQTDGDGTALARPATAAPAGTDRVAADLTPVPLHGKRAQDRSRLRPHPPANAQASSGRVLRREHAAPLGHMILSIDGEVTCHWTSQPLTA